MELCKSCGALLLRGQLMHTVSVSIEFEDEAGAANPIETADFGHYCPGHVPPELQIDLRELQSSMEDGQNGEEKDMSCWECDHTIAAGSRMVVVSLLAQRVEWDEARGEPVYAPESAEALYQAHCQCAPMDLRVKVAPKFVG